ncbi:MAG: tRNA (adenosine(37)-N6)-threonylcarbamoyltransferase complex ATPase subunit type 1 TsaE [Bacteroidales bacterium]|nr:tRNA (adenosine(37)-N6)-threonylcarbamoyltransferase complex ATPase subunit type 1 TsaE [Bacteroidales bacterium]
MNNCIKIKVLEDLPQAAKAVKNALGNHTVLAFHGEMGAGKTTFIKALCSEFGVTDNVSSPTFAIINEYNTPENTTIYHFDLYRLETLEDLQNIGAEDYFYSGKICLVEWPELAEPLFPDNVLNIKISVLEDKTREICF